jgi:hypothetical protein
MRNSVDLNNTHSLDVSYGTDGSDADAYVKAGTQVIGALSNISKNKTPKSDLEIAIKDHCGKRPFFTGKRRKTWNKCKADLIASIDKAKAEAEKTAATQAQAQATQAQAQAIQAQADFIKAKTPPPDNSSGRGVSNAPAKSNKIAGMSKPLFWSLIGVVGLGAIGLTAWLIVKHKRTAIQ